MEYKTEPLYEKTKLKVTDYLNNKTQLEKIVDTIMLGKFECGGYYNKLGAKKRIIPAIIQTLWSLIAIAIVYYIFETYIKMYIPISISETDKSKYSLELDISNLLILISAIFGAVFMNEIRDIHNKWSYLANLFNTVITIQNEPPHSSNEADLNAKIYNKREHLAACLSQDILLMGLWAHESFNSLVKETIEKALIVKYNGDTQQVCSELTRYAEGHLKMDTAKLLISNYIDWLRPESDKIPHLICLLRKNPKV